MRPREQNMIGTIREREPEWSVPLPAGNWAGAAVNVKME